jgi:ketosteroid isomerase-like protein
MSSLLSDRFDLQDLVHDYAAALDERDAAAFGELFTEDVVFVVLEPGLDEPLFGYTGRDDLMQLMGRLDQWGATLHVMSNQRVKIDGDTATGAVYGIAYHTVEHEGAPHTLVMALRYDDRYRREAAGWRFARREITRLWNETRPLMDERGAF